MPINLKKHLQGTAGSGSSLWIDAAAYGQRLLNKGQPAPWGSVGDFVSYHRQLQGLVKSDVLTLDVGDFYQFWLSQNPALLSAMAGKRRLGFALRTLLDDPKAKEYLHEIVKAVIDSNTGTPVVLVMPSPKSWMGAAHCQARQLDGVDVSWDEAESAAMYIAGFLRTFSDCDVSGIMLCDEEGSGPVCADDVARYQPVMNVADYYGWVTVLDGLAEGYREVTAESETLSLGCLADEREGVKLPWEQCMAGERPVLEENSFFYITIPEDAVPEQVLEILNGMRA